MGKKTKSHPLPPLRIWTHMATPFAVARRSVEIATTATPLQHFEIDGIQLAVFQNPRTKHYHVAERTSGALVGFGASEAKAIADVSADIAAAPKTMMRQQIQDAIRAGAHAAELPVEEFWAKFRA